MTHSWQHGEDYMKNWSAFIENLAVMLWWTPLFIKNYDLLIKSAQEETRADGYEEVKLIRQATSFRQAAEWGMHMFQACFNRMKDRFIYE